MSGGRERPILAAFQFLSRFPVRAELDLTPELLRACVDEILTSEHYRLGSARIGRSLREAGGQQAAVREIMRFKRKFGIL